MEATAFLVFGPSGAGKSAVAAALADALDRCAHIEVDALRYMIRGGLVAWSRGADPAKNPAEYARQCELGYENAAALCRQFGEAGFSSVIEGLGDGCFPGNGWAERELPGLRIWSASVVCSSAVLAERLAVRAGWPKALAKAAERELDWYRENSARFDCSVDTTNSSPGAAAATILESLAA